MGVRLGAAGVVVLLAASSSAQTLTERVTALEAQVHTHDDGEHEHGHGHHGSSDWEWAGVYVLGMGSYRWTFHRNGRGVYGAPDLSMKTVVLRGGDVVDRRMILENMHAGAEALLQGSCAPVTAGGALAPGDACYEVVFDLASNTTSFLLNVGAAGPFAVFTAHMPSEFGAVLLDTPAGLKVGPVATLAHEDMHDAHEHAHEHAHSDKLALVALVLAVVANVTTMMALGIWCWHRRTEHPRPIRGMVTGTTTLQLGNGAHEAKPDAAL
jgi:hypothetical protein